MNAINLVSDSAPSLFLRLKIIIQNALIVVIMISWWIIALKQQIVKFLRTPSTKHHKTDISSILEIKQH